MAHFAVLLAAVLAAVAFAPAEAAFRTAPRMLTPQPQPRNLVRAAARAVPTQDCHHALRSCADCSSVLTCTKLAGIFRPIATTACPASAPFCSNGQCVVKLAANDACNQPPEAVSDFTCNGSGYFPSPSDCRKYYLCAGGKAYEYDCSAHPNTVFGHEKDLCVPSSEATCATVTCTRANVGAYQQWKAHRSVYFVCTDDLPANAYVADCGADRIIDAATGDCVLSCLRDGRLADETARNKYYECIRTGSDTFSGPTPRTCPGSYVFDAGLERCVDGSGGGGTDSDDFFYEDETFYPPSDSISEDIYRLPEGFTIGSATSAYQVEGAWNQDGKTESIWDVYLHSRPHMANADVTCDSYHNWREDVKVLKELGMQTYRFAVSWPRLLPKGTQAEGYNPAGVQFYNDLINELIRVGIEPVVTIHHFDTPQIFQNDGGWLSSTIQERLVDYADFVFQTFGDRVKRWITTNEPHIFCVLGHERNLMAPGLGVTGGTAAYECAHNMILAHAKVYRLYSQKYKALQNGTVGIALDLDYNEPGSNEKADIEAAERSHIFTFAWAADPLLKGEYPKLMRDIVDSNSAAAGTKSRLPTFTADEKKLITGAVDFVALNHYSTLLTKNGNGTLATAASFMNDTNVETWSRKTWIASAVQGSVVSPWGFRRVLVWIKDRYNNFPVFVSENGFSNDETVGTTDPSRKGYFSTYMRSMLTAINVDGCNVIGYSAWCLLDNLEWSIAGYTLKSGLTHVDFSDPKRKRTLKDSAALFKEVTSTRKVNYYQPV